MTHVITYGEFLTSHPFFWAAISGAALGGALAAATRSTRRETWPDRARSRKWTFAAAWATGAVVAFTGGVFLAPSAQFFSLRSLYVGGGAAALLFLGLRFPRAGGVPVFLIAALIAGLAPMIVRPFVPLRGSASVATIRVLAIDTSGVYLELTDRTPDRDGLPHVMSLPDQSVIARATVLRISDYLFFLGASGGVALQTVGVPTGDASVAAAPYSDAPFIDQVIDLVPLLALTTVDSQPVRVGLLRGYEVVGLPDYTLSIRRLVDPE